ncbi:DUF4178 domain-containing protein [Stagnihabitans tardus]|uniref:DUF4178 domain-containing protein n=1 Tax=Stagnihabitans tardus TaxID=2699202 RepID=A0AAE4Y834_9RHOB|nr:DUF4178 domain-containing protein [Stagnihabitans tardus]NBZ86904.1 DUF4178 domain-containing protein [Stagnihabitans tardus]
MRAEVAEVACPNCGVGLKALGGGRVVIQVCTHCGSALDAVDNFRLLKTHAELPRPDTPLKLGDKGRIQGVDWVVIGILGWSEAKRWTWTDHQLYSPSHGYAWLTLEEGHLIFSRAWRGAMSPTWMTERGIETAEKPPEIAARGQSYRYYETTDAKVTFAEGEFSWAVMVGDRSKTLSFMSTDAMLTLDQGPEREVEISTYPPQAETWASFGIKAAAPLRVHPLQPRRVWRDERFLSGLGAVATLVATLAWGVLQSQGNWVEPRVLPKAGGLEVEAELPITTTTGVVELRIRTDVYNAWAGIETEVTDPSGTVLFQNAREVGYYAGIEDGESWSEGSQVTSIYFRPTEAGDYGLSLSVPEGGAGEGAGGPSLSRPSLTVYEGRAASMWMLMALVLSALMAGLPLIRDWLHNRARWRGSDWSDD